MKILLIEDEFELGEMYAQQLGKAGHKVKWVRAAQAAIDILDQNNIDLILLDILLPLSNGINFLNEIRSHQDWHRIPVVILSNIPEHELGAPAKLLQKMGVKKYLIKSATSPTELCSEIEHLGAKSLS